MSRLATITVAYLANEFPSRVEPYVSDEILELRRRGMRVIGGSVRSVKAPDGERISPTIVLQPIRIGLMLRAAWLCVTRGPRILPLLGRVLFRGRESAIHRSKALAHTALGAYYAEALKDRGVAHIHVHHGYFGSWIGMVAAKLLDAGFSLTLHGSDLLRHPRYLDAKLRECRFCITISDYNRRQILERYPETESRKVVVSRLGVRIDERRPFQTFAAARPPDAQLQLLSVGRLHAVKDHAFLLRACAKMRASGIDLQCQIAGDGPERDHLESLIRALCLKKNVTLLGHVTRERLNSLYDQADVAVLTSRSEGIPLVLMEAMARGKIVLAPNITGIPELVIDGKTGFLYQPGSEDSFLSQLMFIRSCLPATPVAKAQTGAAQLDWIRHAARAQVLHNYNHAANLESFGDLFLQRITPQIESAPREDFVLQQI